MKGIGKQMPLTMGAFLIGSLSVIGIPPGGGFISKWFLVLGTMQAHQIVMLIVLLVSSVLNAAYFLPIVYQAFFGKPNTAAFSETIAEAPPFCLVPLLVTALCSLVLILFPQPFYELADQTVQAILPYF